MHIWKMLFAYLTRKILVRRAYWGVLGVDGRIILKLKLKELGLSFDWICLDVDAGCWQAV